MNFLPRPLRVAIVCFAAFPLFCGPATAQAPAPPQPVTRDVQAFQEGNAAFDRGAFADAIKSYEGLIKAFATFAQLPEARFRLGYAYYNIGEYDQALEQLQMVVNTKGAPEEVVELALVLTPQVSTAKAAKLPPDDPARDSALAQAVKGFDAYLAKYPASEEAETANYGKALALYQLSKYEDAASTLRASIQRFAQSETIQESQYLLALTVGTIANVAAPPASSAQVAIRAPSPNKS
jgi:outer membrane protein assembly factor BamD (BamD/ComL family)